MKKLIQRLFKTALELNSFDTEPTDVEISSNWLGNRPVSTVEIEAAERRLQQLLPDDYKQLLTICNGFTAVNLVEPSFLPVDQIDYLKQVDPEMIRITREFGNQDLADKLERAIIVAGKEEQSFYLIPPSTNDEGWLYWKYSNWAVGEEPYQSLTDYFNDVIYFMKTVIDKRNGTS